MMFRDYDVHSHVRTTQRPLIMQYNVIGKVLNIKIS